MVSRIEIIPLEVRGYGNIVTPKTSNDFIGKYNEVYTNIDGDFILSYGGVMLKITSNVSNTIKGLTAGLNVIVTTREGGVPVSGLTVDCSIDEVSLTSETTDSNGECSFNWSPQIVGDSVILLTITAQDDYAGLTETKEITIGLLLSFNTIMNDLRLEDDEVYIADITQQVQSRTQLTEFVKDVWVAKGGEPIVDPYGIIHLAAKGDVIVEQDSLDQLSEYDNVLFEGDVELLTGAVYDMSITEDYELIVNCLEREDITPTTITLSADKSILSYADGDSATLTATHSLGAGQTVNLYNASDDSLIGVMTDNGDGTYSYTYNSQGIGDLTLYASDGTISSEIYSIMDTLMFDNCTLTDHNDIWNSLDVNSKFDRYDEYSSLTEVTSGTTAYLNLSNLPNSCTIDFELCQVDGSITSGGLNFYDGNSYKNFISLNNLGYTTSSLGEWIKLRLVYSGGSVTMESLDDSSKTSTKTYTGVINRIRLSTNDTITEQRIRNVHVLLK